MILHEYKIFNAEVLFREDCTADELIDVISANRVYMPCLYVYNKIDQISIEEVDKLARRPNACVVRLVRSKTINIFTLNSTLGNIIMIYVSFQLQHETEFRLFTGVPLGGIILNPRLYQKARRTSRFWRWTYSPSWLFCGACLSCHSQNNRCSF